jgi:peptidoglycan-associated lipoprotein
MSKAVVVVFVAVIAVAGCAKQPGLTQSAAPSPSGAATATSRASTSGNLTGAAARPAAANPSRGGGSAGLTTTARPKPTEYTDNAELQDIHFDFDRYELRDADRRTLDRHATWMQAHPGTLLLVEGHCDERGTAEYNIGLGDRRARATASYLGSRGVATDRITIVSYGEERPVCQEHNEACWSQNRRAHFRVKQP